LRVTVKMSPAVAEQWLRGELESAAARELAGTVKDLGLVLEPMHPGVDHPDLASYFIADTSSPAAAQAAVDRLLDTQAIDSAYVKPPDEPA
jgi:hypothetical protein